MRRRAHYVAADIIFYVGLSLVVLGMFDLLQSHDTYQRAVRTGGGVKRETDGEAEQRIEPKTEDGRNGNLCASTRAGRELVADSLGMSYFFAKVFMYS